MPKISTFVRLALYALLSWVLLAVLWLALPSPSRECSRDPNAYSTALLKAGKTLTRVYEIEDFFPYNDASPLVRQSRSTFRKSFALSYTFDFSRQTLAITDKESPLELISPPSFPFVSPVFQVHAKTGDQDGINPVWFSVADSTLLFWGIHRDTAVVALRARWSELGIFELWPDSQYWDTVKTDGPPPPGLEPMLRLQNFEADNAVAFGAMLPTSAQSSSPSFTYQIRVAIMAIIVPTGLAINALLQFGISIIVASFALIRFFAEILTFYGLLELVIWLVKGRPPVSEHLKTSFPSRHVYALVTRSSNSKPMIWGATGPLEMEGVDEEHSDVARPIPLRTIWDFFKSTSPLDDLLVTFEVTSGWVEPITFGRRESVRNSSDGVVHIGLEAEARSRRSFASNSGEKDLETGHTNKDEKQ